MIGDLPLADTWEMLNNNSSAVLIDVRTLAEWNFVGIPDISETGRELRLVQWTTFPDGTANSDFVAEASKGLEPDQPILLLCRSGARSMAAATALEAAGFAEVYNVSAGFEGHLDDAGHRHGGWKDHLPWRQQ